MCAALTHPTRTYYMYVHRNRCLFAGTSALREIRALSGKTAADVAPFGVPSIRRFCHKNPNPEAKAARTRTLRSKGSVVLTTMPPRNAPQYRVGDPNLPLPASSLTVFQKGDSPFLWAVSMNPGLLITLHDASCIWLSSHHTVLYG